MMPNHKAPASLIKALALILISLFTLSLQAQPVQETQEAPKGDAYTLATCPVSGKALGSGADAVVYNHEGREIRFCSTDCIDKFKADPATYLQKIDAQIIKDQSPFYPLETCVVSGEKLGGDMGKPLDYVYNNRLVRFCGPGCTKDFQKDPEKFLKTLDKAVIDKQSASYPLTTCVVSGEKFGGTMGDPVEVVVGNRLVKLCCNGCAKKLKADPAKYLKMMDSTQTEGKEVSAGSDDPSADVSMATCPMGGTCTKPADAMGACTKPAGAMGTCTKPADAMGACTKPAGAMGACTKPAGAMGACTKPAGAMGACTKPADK